MNTGVKLKKDYIFAYIPFRSYLKRLIKALLDAHGVNIW